jgi:hypothetical protein|tara:strand:- start:1545 stop:1823 length:279 start_codon:yes stop_codon:yes gene_type:complete
MSEKQINKISEMKDIKVFFQNGVISEYLENCYLVTFNEEFKDISVATIDFWFANGFKLVGFGIDDNKKLYAEFNVTQRRLMKGTVKQVLVVQ